MMTAKEAREATAVAIQARRPGRVAEEVENLVRNLHVDIAHAAMRGWRQVDFVAVGNPTATWEEVVDEVRSVFDDLGYRVEVLRVDGTRARVEVAW